MNRDRMEALALDHFGSDWEEDPRVRGFLDAVTDADRDRAEEVDEAASLGDLQPEALLRLVLDTIPAGVFWKDRESRFVGGNRTFAKDIGLDDPAQAVGLDDFDISDRHMAEHYRSIDCAVMESDRPRMRFREPQMRDGELAWLETTKVPLHDRDGQVIGILGSYADVTEQVQHEDMLGAANAELASASRFKDQFLAAVSHELRTPLNPILALTESLMSTAIYGEVNQAQREALDHIARNAKHLHQLIENVLEISTLEIGNQIDLVLSPTLLGELFRKAAGRIGEAAAAKQIRVSTRDDSAHDGHYYVDSRRVERILEVLLDNAVKFTPAGGEITLGAEELPGGETIALSVTDNGIGIAEADQAEIFRSFGQVDRELARAFNGAGLGLALAKHLAEQHGGGIEVRSAPGEGSTFTLNLPARTEIGDPAKITNQQPENTTQ